MAIKQRSYPADTKMINELTGEIFQTFLNNKEINAELYSYYLARAEKYYNQQLDQWEVRLDKKNIESAKTIGEVVGISQPTFRKYREILIEKEYLVDKGDYYLLPYKESFFFELPLESIQFLLDTVKTPVVKTLIYLGHQYEWKKVKEPESSGYVFTLEELAEHIGQKTQNNARNYARLNNYLDMLEACGFVKISEFYEGKIPKKRIYYLNKDRKKLVEPIEKKQ